MDVAQALAWRDFMVSDYSDAGQERWLAGNGIALLRGSGRLAGTGVVEVGGVAYRAGHVVLANGAEPFVPPISGLRELDGIWTNREVTGMRAVPRRLIVLGGGPVGVEMAQAVRRLGGQVVLVERGPHLLPREPAVLGVALAEVLRRDGVEISLGVEPVRAGRIGQDDVLGLADGRVLRGDRLLVAAGRRPRVHGIGDLPRRPQDAPPAGVRGAGAGAGGIVVTSALHGRTVVLIGGSAGIGLETARSSSGAGGSIRARPAARRRRPAAAR